MAATGYLDASAMASAFNMLLLEDLIWSFVVNNYMKGKLPLRFRPIGVELALFTDDRFKRYFEYLRHC